MILAPTPLGRKATCPFIHSHHLTEHSSKSKVKGISSIKIKERRRMVKLLLVTIIPITCWAIWCIPCCTWCARWYSSRLLLNGDCWKAHGSWRKVKGEWLMFNGSTTSLPWMAFSSEPSLNTTHCEWRQKCSILIGRSILIGIGNTSNQSYFL